MKIQNIIVKNQPLFMAAVLEEDNMFPDGKKNTDQYVRYLRALTLLKPFVDKGQCKVSFDDPEKSLIAHGCVIEFLTDEFNSLEEITAITEIMRCFDGMMFVGDVQGNISIVTTIKVYE